MQLHHRRLQLSTTIKYCLLTCIAGMFFPANADSTTESNATNNIVVTTKPLYSLVAHLTVGISDPILLSNNTSTPHHYTMRPSERRLLAKANIIIWPGADIEPQLDKIIKQQGDSAYSISALQAKKLTLLDKRSKHPRHGHEPATNEHSRPNLVDPHIWLSAHNAAQISKHISKRLTTYDPINSAQYKKNLTQLLNKIELTKRSIEKNLSGSKQPYLVFHDAFQYFENEYSLNHIAAINYDDETGGSLKHMQQITNLIKTNGIRCLVYQPPKSTIIDKLTSKTAIAATELDPLGRYVSDDTNAWFEIMRQMSSNFSTCLNQ